VLPTISSRCQLVRFDAPPLDRVAGAVQELGAARDRAEACARLSLGDLARARELAGEQGLALRAAGERFARTTLAGEAAAAKPWVEILTAVRGRGEAVREELEREANAQLELYPRKERKRVETEWSERIRRAPAAGRDGLARPRAAGRVPVVCRPRGDCVGGRTSSSATAIGSRSCGQTPAAIRSG